MPPHPDYPPLKYDSFPNAQPEDMMHTEIIGRKLILTAQQRIGTLPNLRVHRIRFCFAFELHGL